MNRKLILVVFGITALAAGGITLAQTAPTRAPSPTLDYAVPLTTAVAPASKPQPGNAEPKPEDLTIDQILDAVDNIREQKAELDKKERLYLKALHRKTEKLKERIERMDTETPQQPATPVPVSPVMPPQTPVLVPGTSSVVPISPGSP